MSVPEAPPDPQLALLDAVFTNAPVGLAFWDRQLRYRRINESLAAMNGVPPEEHLDRTPQEVLGDLGEDVAETLRIVLETGEPVLNLEVAGETPAAPGEQRFWDVSYYPVVSPAGETVGVAAAVMDFTDQHEAAAERVQLLKDALSARAHAEAARLRAEDAQRIAEAARARTEFLAEAGRRLATSMDFETTLQQVAEIAVPSMADWCSISIAEPSGDLRVVAVAHRDAVWTDWARRDRDRWPSHLRDLSGPGWVVRTAESELVSPIEDEQLVRSAHDPEHLEALRSLGLTASLIVPLRTPLRVIGALSFAMAESGRGFDEDDVSLAQALAARAALHVRNAQLYTERSHIARTLQAGLLPRELPRIPGVQVSARYVAAGDQNDVGGDFYDVFPSVDGVWAALIGDVTGKGPEAAALTSLARHTLRTAGLHDQAPSANLELLNRAMLADTASTRFCTVVQARVCPSPGSALVTLSNGGHPPPYLLRADGSLEAIDIPGTLVGGVPDPHFEDRDLRLGPGDLLLFYTDGVTELRTDDPEVGERILVETLRSCAGEDAEAVVAAVQAAALAAQPGQPRDDVALLALRVEP